jgi:CHAT domain-containing protein
VKLLGVAAERAQDPSMPRLRRVEEEVREAIDVVTRAGVSATFDLGTMPKAHLLTSLRSANIVHLACHGVQHVTDPHKSRFCLSTGDLTALELAEMDLKDPFFAFLSACDTAKGDQKHADEVVHLAATMLFVGFKSVVATMWCVF